jgi:hypothetical protein
VNRLPDISGDKLVPGDPEILLDPEIPITKWVLDKVITVPYEHLPKPVSFAYFATIGVPIIGIGALGGFAADKVNHYVVHPAIAALEKLADAPEVAALGKLAEVTGVEDGVESLVDETASTINESVDLLAAAARAGGAASGQADVGSTADKHGDRQDGASPSEPAPGGGVLLRAEDAPPTADPEPSEAREPGWGVLLPPDERAQRERAETGGATTRAEAHREPESPPEPPPTRHLDPPASQAGPGADTTAPPRDNEPADGAGGPATGAPMSGQPPQPPAPITPPPAQNVVPASMNTEQPAAQDDAAPPPEQPYPVAGETSQTTEEAEQPYPMAGEEPQIVEAGDYPMPEPDRAPVVDAPPPEPEPAEEAPAEEAEGG